MERNNIIKGFLCLSMLSIAFGCSKLDEEVIDGVGSQNRFSSSSINATSVLGTAYNGLRGFMDQDKMFAMEEMSTDAMAGPTRGGDWDDNGKWRQIHAHTWDANNTEIRNAWNSLLSNVHNCNLVISNSTVASEIAQARFLRAFYYFYVVDLFGQAPYRPAGSSLTDDAKVYSRTEATAFIISELEAILPNLPDRTPNDASKANKDAARFLLAKVYLNKGVYANAEAPTFAAADMTKVVQYVDALTSSLNMSGVAGSGDGYWANFGPDNNTSNEIIFSGKNLRNGDGGGIQSRWRMGTHYNQTPSGWNGFTTVADFYNTFNAADKRAKYSTPAIIQSIGNPVGFNVGQMYAPGGVTPLKDRNGKPLVFTTALTLITTGDAIETAGARGMKYIPDAANLDKPENDYVLMRHADALLMKAEAILRGGTGTIGTALTDIAARAGVSAAPNTLDGIYAERGRELWWEGWRRNDMIRFGKFLNARALKPSTSSAKYLLYPIPADALLNANLKQNPGY